MGFPRGQRKRELSIAEVATITAAYSAGVPVREIAVRFRVTERGIHYRLRRMGLSRARPASPQVIERRNRIYALLGQGQNLRRTARALGLTYDGLRKWLLRHLPALHAHWKQVEHERHMAHLRALWKEKRRRRKRRRRRRVVRRLKRRSQAAEAAVRLYLAGYGIRWIASYAGWSRGAIHRFLCEAGVPLRTSTARSPGFWRKVGRRRRRIQDLAATGMPRAAIARRLRVSVPTVREALA